VLYRRLIKIAALTSSLWMSASAAVAENRMALVIGNSNYATVTALPNPANDAKAMTKFLSSAGFQVIQAPNLTQSNMRRTISNFASMVAEKGRDTVALVFYAGHGLQVDGENYLVPVDANIQREADVPLQAMRLADVMNAMAAVPSKTLLVILDACRNNPFSEINKTTGRGLAIVDAPTGSLVSYATAPGTEALDGDGANSPYTSALLKIGQEPGLPIEQALKRVRLAVNEATNRQQTPWESSSLTSEFSFFPSGRATMASTGQLKVPSASPAAASSGSAPAETRSVESWQKELKSRTPRDAYDIIIREDKVEAYQAYLALYPSQSLAPVVRTLVERRREMIAWHDAVIINTVASYQTFLASYASSDFAATADRLVERARTRSLSNAASAFASVGATCPCSQPTPAPRQRRTDVSPSNNPTGPVGPAGPARPASATGPAAPVGPTGPAPYNPPVQVYDPIITPPPVRIVTPPPHIHIPPAPPYGGNDKPTGGGNDKPTGGNDKPTGGNDKPTWPNGGGKPDRPTGPTGSTGGDKPTGPKGPTGGKPPIGSDKPIYGNDKSSLGKLGKFGKDKPQITRALDPRSIRTNSGNTARSLGNVKPAWVKPMRPQMTTGLATRNLAANRSVMIGRGMTIGRPTMIGRGMTMGRPMMMGGGMTVGRPMMMGGGMTMGRPMMMGSGFRGGMMGRRFF
jgi:uncharacterized caspase-like protein